ncbi:MAG: hypothetical protein JWN25_3181, partial [Verrucomicrobiales bacterium]|nr:hypothetical protein [Verrucomicrobiales bacterium]
EGKGLESQTEREPGKMRIGVGLTAETTLTVKEISSRLNPWAGASATTASDNGCKRKRQPVARDGRVQVQSPGLVAGQNNDGMALSQAFW